MQCFLVAFVSGTSSRRNVVVRTCFIVLSQITVWYIFLHYHLQFFNQLRETWASRWVLPPALSHQFISVMDAKEEEEEKRSLFIKL